MDFNQQPDLAVRPSDAIEFKALLLVDDDKQLASALQWILADENFLVDVANDGEEALLKVKANEYDAVVCDVMMPKLRGDEFYTKARELRRERGRDHGIYMLDVDPLTRAPHIDAYCGAFFMEEDQT